MSAPALTAAAGDFPGLSTECVQDWHTECRYQRCACDCHEMPRVSARQRAILREIEEHTRRCGYPPSLRELAEAVGVSSADTVSYHVKRLVGLGLLTHAPGKPRTLAIPTGR